ncbi:MAG TPA: tetratricopeptide repeat protein, partial [Polyangiaceae bacterium]|nr:tetratricopeptide repeat protein [Polyangiaceae bacterium]
GRVGEAEPILKAARARFPDEPRLAVLTARLHLRAGRTEAARALLEPLATRHDELGVTALAWLGVVELVLGRPREAAGAARRSLELDPDEPLAAHVLAEALEALGDPTAAAWAARARRAR